MTAHITGMFFLISCVGSFNAALWQFSRRSQKAKLMKSHENLKKDAVIELPDSSQTIEDIEFTRVELQGTMDNEGSVLVGPRAIPSYKGAANSAEEKGGFLVMTPFEIANTHQFVLVNRGWVPTDAAKHRLYLAQYIGEGFTPMKLRGIYKREEWVGGTWENAKENHEPLPGNLGWLVMRPFDMALDYYKKRWGEDQMMVRREQHGARHYFVEQIEDFSGEDQRLVKGRAWPRRRDTDEVTYVHLTPFIHSCYFAFWLIVCGMSAVGTKMCFTKSMSTIKMRKIEIAKGKKVEALRKKEAVAFNEACQNAVNHHQSGKTAVAAGHAAVHNVNNNSSTTSSSSSSTSNPSSSNKDQ